ncbi:NAD-dependent succinate-semialdehyde dehydrogenase [Marinilabiliaceae bacterium JC017]|nr:NAD-dependent succinate-semialdehyde dehydrogenase [Marinilabiliaceae bacterium JC017]
MQLKSINPVNGEIIREYPQHQSDEIKNILEGSAKAYFHWKKTPLPIRSELLKKTALLLREKKEGLAFNITIEMGKSIKEAKGEIEKCAAVCDYYADNGPTFLERENIPTEASMSYACFQPIGPILAIMPWNFPFWQVFRFAAPALMAGNTAILKHASNVPACASAIENIFKEAGFPENTFKTLLVSHSKVEHLITDKRIKAITLTGSTPAGKAVAAIAGKHLKKVVLELGGSDPYLILEDADIKQAVEACVSGRLLNAGQSCIGAKRFIVVEKKYKTFEEQFVERMRQAQTGDPFNETIDYGPLARHNLREDLHLQVVNSINKGAQLVTGGVIPEGAGAFYPPTVLTNVTPGMPAYNEELFGPVAALIKAKDEAEGIAIANDTHFGLGAAIFTSDTERGRLIAEKEIEAGCCFVNDFVRSDPRLPFGGIKESGYGRELSHYGMKEFLNIKTVYVK